MKRKMAVVAGIGVLVLISGFIAVPRVVRITQALTQNPYEPDGIGGTVEWAYQGTTVAEMVGHADLIVRAHVLNTEARELRQLLEQYEGTTPTGKFVEDVMPFTDSQMQVLEVYMGSAEDTVMVMQTGGQPETADPAAAPFLPDGLYGHPIFKVGSEHILFLIDITNDGVHSTGRKLYIVVNPFGRYEIRDGELVTAADRMAMADRIAAGLPTTLDELLAQIKELVED